MMPTTPLVLMVTSASFVYAVLRYTVCGDVPIEHLPLYVTNKAAALAGILLIGLASLGRTHERRKSLGLAGFALTGVHALASLALLEPAYYPKLYLSTARLNWAAELSLLAGVVGCVPLIWLFWETPRAPVPETPGRRSLIPWLGRALLLSGALHVLFLGYRGWLDIDEWPGRLPPITLLSFVIAVGALAAKLRISRNSPS